MSNLKLNPAVASLEEEGAFFVLDKALKMKAEGRPVINLGIGQPDFSPPAPRAGGRAQGGPGWSARIYFPGWHAVLARGRGNQCGHPV